MGTLQSNVIEEWLLHSNNFTQLHFFSLWRKFTRFEKSVNHKPLFVVVDKLLYDIVPKEHLKYDRLMNLSKTSIGKLFLHSIITAQFIFIFVASLRMDINFVHFLCSRFYTFFNRFVSASMHNCFRLDTNANVSKLLDCLENSCQFLS